MNPVTNFIDSNVVLGKNVTVWHFAVILSGCFIGDNVSIGSRTEIGRRCRIGGGTRISSGVFLPSDSIVGHNVFIGPGVVFTDDRYPRANTDYRAEPPIIHDGASIGAGSVILPGVVIGANAVIGAGAVVTRNVYASGHVRGEPARVRTLSLSCRDAMSTAP